MRVVIQRVKSASVHVNDQLVSSIGRGLMILVGISRYDQKQDLEYITRKVLSIRLFEGENGQKWDLSVKDANLEILCVSQFTLYGELKGNKLDFRNAMSSDTSREFYNTFLDDLRKAYSYDKVKDGVFGAMMDVSLINEGPVTYTLDTNPQKTKADDQACSTSEKI